MNSPCVYLNGSIIPWDQARISIADLAIVQGATVTERLRTVQHRPYCVAEHLDRLNHSLARVGWSLPGGQEDLHGVIHDIALRNAELIPDWSDLSIVIWVSAGQALGDAWGLIPASQPTVCVSAAPLPLADWAPAFETGLALAIPETRQIPQESLDPHIKCRSRLHWNIADREVRQRHPHAQALLRSLQGFVTETATGNLFVVRDGALQTPRAEITLNGIAQQVVIRLAAERGWTCRRSDLTPEDVASADEVFLTSSTYCLLPVGTLDGQGIRGPIPGAFTKCLVDAWSAEIGLDLEAQCLRALHP